MDSIAGPIDTEAASDSVGTKVLCDFRVHGADKVAERLDSVLLANLQSDARTSRHLLGHLRELGKDTLVNLKELLSSRSIQVEHLHGGDLETFSQDSVNNLTGVASLDGVRLDHGAGVVGEESACFAFTREPHAHLGSLLLIVRRAVNGIADGVGTESGTKGS